MSRTRMVEKEHLKVSEFPPLETDTGDVTPLHGSREVDQVSRRELLPRIFGFDITADWGSALSEPLLSGDRLTLAAQRALCKMLLIKLECRLFELVAMGCLTEDVKALIEKAMQHETENFTRLTERMLTAIDPVPNYEKARVG